MQSKARRFEPIRQRAAGQIDANTSDVTRHFNQRHAAALRNAARLLIVRADAGRTENGVVHVGHQRRQTFLQVRHRRPEPVRSDDEQQRHQVAVDVGVGVDRGLAPAGAVDGDVADVAHDAH